MHINIVKCHRKHRITFVTCTPHPRSQARVRDAIEKSYSWLQPPDLRWAYKRCVTYIHVNETSSLTQQFNKLTGVLQYLLLTQ